MLAKSIHPADLNLAIPTVFVLVVLVITDTYWRRYEDGEWFDRTRPVPLKKASVRAVHVQLNIYYERSRWTFHLFLNQKFPLLKTAPTAIYKISYMVSLKHL